MTATWRAFSGMNPYWTSNQWFYATLVTSLTAPTGVTHVTSAPAHPFAGAASEQVIEFDMSASHEAVMSVHFGDAADGAISVPPDATKRWGQVEFCDIYVPSAHMPSSEAVIAYGPQIQLTYDGSGIVRLYDLITTPGTPILIGASSASMTTDAYRQLELWRILNDSAGNRLATDQWVVREVLLTTPFTATTLINANYNITGFSAASTTFTRRGETTGRGAGVWMRQCNFAGGWQDADNTPGIIRIDPLTPNGISAGTNMDQWGGTAGGADVDESGTGVPDDITTVDTVSTSSSVTKTEMYTMTAPNYCTTGDTVFAVMESLRVTHTAPAKGGVGSITPLIGDGTTLKLDATTTPTYATWLTMMMNSRLNPGGTAWAPADLAGVEGGVRYVVTGGNLGTINLSTVSMQIIYQKSGETTAALPAPVAAGTTRNVVMMF